MMNKIITLIILSHFLFIMILVFLYFESKGAMYEFSDVNEIKLFPTYIVPKESKDIVIYNYGLLMKVKCKVDEIEYLKWQRNVFGEKQKNYRYEVHKSFLEVVKDEFLQSQDKVEKKQLKESYENYKKIWQDKFKFQFDDFNDSYIDDFEVLFVSSDKGGQLATLYFSKKSSKLYIFYNKRGRHFFFNYQ